MYSDRLSIDGSIRQDLKSKVLVTLTPIFKDTIVP